MFPVLIPSGGSGEKKQAGLQSQTWPQEGHTRELCKSHHPFLARQEEFQALRWSFQNYSTRESKGISYGWQVLLSLQCRVPKSVQCSSSWLAQGLPFAQGMSLPEGQRAGILRLGTLGQLQAPD